MHPLRWEWISRLLCRLHLRHAYGFHFEPYATVLVCRHCGKRTEEANLQPRVDAVLHELEQAIPTMNNLRRIPMDMVATAVLRQLVADRAPVVDGAIREALLLIASRNGVSIKPTAPSAF